MTIVPNDCHVSWSGCWNARDLGGLPTAGDHATRWGAVVRAALRLGTPLFCCPDLEGSPERTTPTYEATLQSGRGR
jgi:hypothetical protein